MKNNECCYKMEMNQIGTRQINSQNKCGNRSSSMSLEMRSDSNYKRRKSYSELTKHAEEVDKLIQVRCKNYNAERTFALQIISQRIDFKEISFNESFEQTSVSFSEDLAIGKLENRLQYLRRKYTSKWKTFVKKNIISRTMVGKDRESSACRGNDSRCSLVDSDESEKSVGLSSNKLMYDGGQFDERKQRNYKKQNKEQIINTARERELARLKLEEELFTRDVQAMLRKNMKPTTESDLKSVIPNRLNKEDQKKTDTIKVRAGWDLVSRMELRAQERQQKWENIRERKQRLEMEKAEKMRIEEEKRRQMEDEEKKQRILKVKQEIKRRFILKKLQEKERNRLNHLNMKADEHYRIHLLKSSFTSFVLHLEQCRISMVHATSYYNTKLLTQSLVALNLFRRIEITKKREIANEFHETQMLKRVFDAFKKIHTDYLHEMKKSEEFNRFRMIRNYFSKWYMYYVNQKCKHLEKEEFAIRHHERVLMKRCFQNWKQLPLIHFQEREKEQRFRSWCSKIQELLPNFQLPSE